MRISRFQLGAVVAAAVLAAAACGSTVPESERRLAAGRLGTGDGLDRPAALDGAGSLETTDGSVAGGGGTAAAGGAGRNASRGATAAAGTGTGTGSSGKAVVPPGVTDTTINIGLMYTENGGAANAALGAAGITQGDERANYRILIDDINRNGGVAGRKLVPIFKGLDATSTESTDSMWQAACEHFTRDNKVFAVFAGTNDTFRECVTKRGVLAIDNGGLTLAGESVYERYPDYVEITSINLDRMAALMLPGVNAQGYFNGWDANTGRPGPAKAKVGVVVWDLPSFNHMADKVLVPGLAKMGYSPAAGNVIKIAYPARNSDLGATTASVSSAVLKLHSDGVSHVFVMDINGLLTLLFTREADSQRYIPKYGSNTQNGFQALADAGALPKSQLVGVVGIGWLPSIDVPASENTDDGPYSNDARRRCMKLMKDNGETYSDVNAAAVALGACDSLWFFRDVMKLAPPPINRVNYLTGVHKLGAGFQSTGAFATRFEPTKHDGVAAYRYWSYVPACECVQYTSGNKPV